MTKKSGLDLEYIDPNTAAGDDFFRHLNGAWIDTYEIPADRSKDGGIYFLRDDAEKNVRTIVEKIADENPESHIGALYNAFMDTEKIEADGVTPLQREITPVFEAQTHDQLIKVLAEGDKAGIGTLFGWYTSIDAKNPGHYTVYMSQSGLGLPDESYYREDKFAEVREAYIEHIERMFTLTGASAPLGLTPNMAAQIIMAHETEIASHHWDNVRNRDADKRYNPVAAADLNEKFPGFDFEAYIEGIGSSVEEFGTVVLSQPSFFEEAAKMWTSVPLMTWKLWFIWRMISARASLLNEEMVEANFDFYGRTLSGAQEVRERWKRGISLLESYIADQVGKEYVAVHFPPTHKAKMLELVDNLIEAYRESITTLEWMTDETRARALEKLDQFVTKIGYPDKWRDYSDLELAPGDLFESVRRAILHEHNFMLARIGKPVDKTEWLMSPQTVNAYYMPPANEIVFPAAILQPPYFDPEADDAVNYGGIGAIIGHEIGHGFDDQGSKYDGTGALNNWWTETDREEFTKRTASLVDQYNGYTPTGLDPEKFTVNGELTLGENIGDLGGLSIALKAYKIALAQQGINSLADAPVIDGYTGVQRVLMSWGIGWRTKARQQYEEMMISVDPHSPSEFRVNGIVRNLDEFYEAFNVTPEHKLYLAPEQRVAIW
ncbi:M13 family metallopeptidase [Rothia sp. ZJ932]|uniref:M13 family metallopeptidase n=1 Tax=Rothia sp. ZJ932 TaxID=2810516 RepID=UPI00196711BF|nr:M13-type metalloendopeptidase [Rothia sp. ZJ932]QRZ61496.1 peptidase M13 [Rothia sp. ZJ932]